MYQVVVQYLEDRYASFYVDHAIESYQLLLKKVKSCIPYLRNVNERDIRISYKDIQLDQYINIDSEESGLHLSEAFRNVFKSESGYSRIQLKARECDSPFRSRSKGQSETDNMPVRRGNSHAESKSAKSLVFPKPNPLSRAVDWKIQKQESLDEKMQCLNDKKFALETHMRELETNVVAPPHVGTYQSVCGNCHVRVHRAEGNRGGSCINPPCNSYLFCGQKKKHPEHFEEIRSTKKQLRDVGKEIDNAIFEKKNIEAFQSKSISAFATSITPRLLKVLEDKYNVRTAAGKIALQRDIATLRLACENKVPPFENNDRELFESLLDKQRKKMGSLSTTNENQSLVSVNLSGHHTQITVSPVHSAHRKKLRRPSTSTSDSDSSSDESSEYESPIKKKHKKKKSKHRYKAKSSKRNKKSHRSRSHHHSSSSDEVNEVDEKCEEKKASTKSGTKCINLDELAAIALAVCEKE